MAFRHPDDASVARLLRAARRIAVVGLSPKPHRASHGVSRYMQQAGYEIVPVYPREDTILGARVYRRVQDIPGAIDIVNVFRRGEELPGVVEDAVTAGARSVWFQVGCFSEAAASRATGAGLTVVMDRCIMVEHSRLVGP
jgi:predicted CoA-binding protein